MNAEIKAWICLTLAIVFMWIAFVLHPPQVSKIDMRANEAVVDRQTVEEMQISEQELRMELDKP